MSKLQRVMMHLERAKALLSEVLENERNKQRPRNQPRRSGPAPASGFKGVYMDKRTKRWGAKVWDNGADRWLGTYETAEQAAAVVTAFYEKNSQLPQSK